ncbi:MAG: recombinase family protein [Bacillati bacterium ANGP1]|uniref:Recombinase family protein n=1 Tax=Candidatus Segetimicrobium genomatis TaxID=2569760 RepID=A0A537J1D4_9BACT|nr:MAG: recombinase family protein [Terrabacteria group bacterium ANGP1]
MKTAAIYARVSSDRQKEEQTIASQTSALRAYAAEHQYVVPDGWVFEDEGWSGATLVRPGLERVRDLAAQGQLEAVLVYSPDRLSSSKSLPATAWMSCSSRHPERRLRRRSCYSNSRA